MRDGTEKCATQRNGTVGKKRAGNEVGKNYVIRPQQNSAKQPSRNSRTNLSHTLKRRRGATARQSSISYYGAYYNNKLIYGNAVGNERDEKVENLPAVTPE